jgi:uncharacterized protein (TIGR00251 family)
VTLPRIPKQSISPPALSSTPHILETSEGLVLNLWVQPGAKKSGWAGTHGDQLKLMIQAPPVEDAANQGCLVFLADWFGVKKSEVLLLKGEKSRSKRFLLKGLALEKALSLTPGHIPDRQG